MKLDPAASNDALGDALHILRMNGAFYCRSELSEPWGLTLPAMPGYLWFHVVVSGRVLLEYHEGGVKTLERGDLALLPHGEGHELRSDPGASTPSIVELEREAVSDRYEILRHGGGGDLTTVICAAVKFDEPTARDLMSSLPEAIVVGASDSPQVEWIEGVLRLLSAETRGLRPGGEAVITRLADILLIQTLRSWIETDPAATRGWLGAVRDPQIGRAIALIHRDPGRRWTVASLASELAMSRSAFADRFTSLVGETPIAYVTRHRMRLAREVLRSQGSTVAELAERFGYRSEAAFARAFKRETGESPGRVRRSVGIDPALAQFMLTA